MAQPQPQPHSATELRHGRRHKLHQTLSDSFIVFGNFRLKSAAWLKFVTRRWVPSGLLGSVHSDRAAPRIGPDANATAIQAWWRGTALRRELQWAHSTPRALRANVRRRHVRTVSAGNRTPVQVSFEPTLQLH